MTACAAVRRTLAHGLQLGGDLLQCPIRRRGPDADDQADQPIRAALRPGAVQQAGRDDALRGRRTVRRSRSTVQVMPGCWFNTRTTSPQGWAGRIRCTVGSQVSSCARTGSSQVLSRLCCTLRMARSKFPQENQSDRDGPSGPDSAYIRGLPEMYALCKQLRESLVRFERTQACVSPPDGNSPVRGTLRGTGGRPTRDRRGARASAYQEPGREVCWQHVDLRSSACLSE